MSKVFTAAAWQLAWSFGLFFGGLQQQIGVQIPVEEKNESAHVRHHSCRVSVMAGGGRVVSGRTWKKTANKTSKLIARKVVPWEKKVEERTKAAEIKDVERQMKKARMDGLKAKKDKREAKRKRKDENELRAMGAQAQVITNTTKIRKWHKKAKNQLVKMSPEMITKLYGARLKGM
eukprot:GHVS01104072.1.p1 GENE.GHVS01104072.1~~GHVS01104072.1.p1  ORF type:complete len:176 (-),score=36.25 GHVS01104072.1:242-769(-)